MVDLGNSDNSDFLSLLLRVGPTRTQQQLKEFMIACARQIESRFSDDRSLRALDVAERYARGEASRTELESARTAAQDVVSECAQRGATSTGTLSGAILEGTETENIHLAVWEPFAQALSATVVVTLLSSLADPAHRPVTEATFPGISTGWQAEAASRFRELSLAATEQHLPDGIVAAGGIALLVGMSEALLATLAPGFLASEANPDEIGSRVFNDQLGKACELLQQPDAT